MRATKCMHAMPRKYLQISTTPTEAYEVQVEQDHFTTREKWQRNEQNETGNNKKICWNNNQPEKHKTS